MAMGMQMLHLSCIGWVRVLRPSSYARTLLRERVAPGAGRFPSAECCRPPTPRSRALRG